MSGGGSWQRRSIELEMSSKADKNQPYFLSQFEINLIMHIITRKTLIQFWEKHPDSRNALMRWFKIVQNTEFNGFAELRAAFPSVDKVDHWIIFNIGDNKYRLIVAIHFNRGKLYIRHVLTHVEYDRGDWKNDTHN